MRKWDAAFDWNQPASGGFDRGGEHPSGGLPLLPAMMEAAPAPVSCDFRWFAGSVEAQDTAFWAQNTEAFIFLQAVQDFTGRFLFKVSVRKLFTRCGWLSGEEGCSRLAGLFSGHADFVHKIVDAGHIAAGKKSWNTGLPIVIDINAAIFVKTDKIRIQYICFRNQPGSYQQGIAGNICFFWKARAVRLPGPGQCSRLSDACIHAQRRR